MSQIMSHTETLCLLYSQNWWKI